MFGKKKKKKQDIFVVFDGKVPDAALNPRKQEWTEDSFMEFTEAGDFYDEPASISLDFDQKKLSQIYTVILIAISILLFRAVYLQLYQGDELRQMAEYNRLRKETVKAQRGIIYDRNGMQLVENVPKFSLTVVPADLPQKQEQRAVIINRIAQIINEDPQTVDEIISEVKKNSKYYFQPVIIKDYLDYNNAIIYTIESEKLPGVQLTVSSWRNYLNKIQEDKIVKSLSHILGYVGKITAEELEEYKDRNYLYNDSIGKNGIESYYEVDLKGKDGVKESEFDALGNEIKIISESEPIHGKNIYLTLDFEAQQKLEDIVNQYLEKFKKSKAVAIAQDPNNGEIIAMVSAPSYDINDFSKGISTEKFSQLINDENKPLLNRAIQGEYPSGSTFKPIVAAAALQEGIVNEYTSFLSVGGIRIGVWFFPDWQAGGHGSTNVKKALADSVNTFFYIVGGGYQQYNGLGHQKINQYASEFGLGTQLQIDLPGEKSGFLPDKDWKMEVKNEEWYIGDTYHLAIGQGDLLVTPLQIANVTSVFANNGTLYRPHLVKEFRNIDIQEKYEKVVDIINKDFISKNNIDIVRQGMRQAVVSGSARTLSTLPFSSAAKTGTAQWNTNKDPHAWFTSFAPYEDPEITVTVLIEEGIEGSKTAVLVAKDFLNWYMTR